MFEFIKYFCFGITFLMCVVFLMCMIDDLRTK